MDWVDQLAQMGGYVIENNRSISMIRSFHGDLRIGVAG